MQYRYEIKYMSYSTVLSLHSIEKISRKKGEESVKDQV